MFYSALFQIRIKFGRTVCGASITAPDQQLTFSTLPSDTRSNSTAEDGINKDNYVVSETNYQRQTENYKSSHNGHVFILHSTKDE
jgi:hypothetical protein